MDPKPFPRRFIGRIRSLTSTICNHGRRLKDANTPLLRAFSNTRFASRDSTAIYISRMVTGLVTVNGNNEVRREGLVKHGSFSQYFLPLSYVCTSRHSTGDYAEPRLPGLLSNLP